MWRNDATSLIGPRATESFIGDMGGWGGGRDIFYSFDNYLHVYPKLDILNC